MKENKKKTTNWVKFFFLWLLYRVKFDRSPIECNKRPANPDFFMWRYKFTPRKIPMLILLCIIIIPMVLYVAINKAWDLCKEVFEPMSGSKMKLEVFKLNKPRKLNVYLKHAK